MITIRNKAQVVIAACGVTALSFGAMLVHVQINYSPEMREIVRVRATLSTCIVAFPLSFFFMVQMLKNHLLSQELQRLVNRDRLTDVATRDFFFERLTHSENAYGVSLMIDIDHFKHVNDTHGHLAGDDVIQAVADVMKSQVREQDIVCRFGGEEFVVFLHSATPQEGWEIAERIRSKTEACTTHTSVGMIKVTVSVGGSLKTQLEHVDSAIKRADECLYNAKSSGRNRTVVDWDQPTDDAAEAAA